MRKYSQSEVRPLLKAITPYAKKMMPIDINLVRDKVPEKFSNSQIISAWNLISIQSAINSSRILNKIHLEPNDIHHFVAIARNNSVSPVGLLKRFLSLRFNRKTVENFFRNVSSAPKEVRELIEIAWENDIDNPTAHSLQNKGGVKFERELEEWLNLKKIDYKTQEDLVAEQIKKYGRAVNTPDIVFFAPEKINGVIATWIDAKSYFLIPGVSIIKKSLIKQGKRYVAEFGPGIFMFKQGFVEGVLNVPEITLMACPLE